MAAAIGPDESETIEGGNRSKWSIERLKAASIVGAIVHHDELTVFPDGVDCPPSTFDGLGCTTTVIQRRKFVRPRSLFCRKYDLFYRGICLPISARFARSGLAVANHEKTSTRLGYTKVNRV